MTFVVRVYHFVVCFTFAIPINKKDFENFTNFSRHQTCVMTIRASSYISFAVKESYVSPSTPAICRFGDPAEPFGLRDL
jgi:hypothetical protein